MVRRGEEVEEAVPGSEPSGLLVLDGAAVGLCHGHEALDAGFERRVG